MAGSREPLTAARAEEILDGFPMRKLLVIGDLMLDRYIRGRVDRISPEAPVPVVLTESESYAPGGAANVVNNLHSLGARSAVVGIIGDDREGVSLRELLGGECADVRGVVVDSGCPTLSKTRIIAHHQQVVRVDREGDGEIRPEVLEQILQFLASAVREADGVILSDYDKGMVSARLIEEVKSLVRGTGSFVVVDPKERYYELYRDVECMTPNRKEASRASGMAIRTREEAEQAGREILARYGSRSVLLTLGEDGMCLLERDADPTHIHTVAQEVYDVTGAGDTVVGVFALGLASGASRQEAAYLANLAAGVVVGKVGTATATREEILTQMARKMVG